MSELAAARSGRERTDEALATPVTRSLGAVATLLLFIVGLAIGVATQTYLAPAAPSNRYGELPLVNEPPESAALVQLILADDARGLAASTEGEILRELGKALQPLREVFEMKFTGAVERRGEILAAYVATGRDRGTQSSSVGVVFRVSGGKVVGVN